ncbi:hypothetical protein IWW48_005395 [Coemansia sp. RSA 1200]|nr:hypothetical protein IWW48_005395 [Coemansia sp. RSA 1200]
MALPLEYQSGKARLQAWRVNNPEPSEDNVGQTDHDRPNHLPNDPIANWISPQITKMLRRSRAESSISSINETMDTNQTQGSGSVEPMERRIVEEIVRLFGSSGVFYSYIYDLTRSLQTKGGHLPDNNQGLLLSQTACHDYWFNRNLLQPLIKQRAYEWTLPMIQGCVQVAACTAVNGDNFHVSIISRRCIRRIGMRYERRGANSEGDDDNVAVCAAHLRREIERLGRQILVNLVEHKGREAVVGSKYTTLVGICVADDIVDAQFVRYIPWDFHRETHGMRFENIKQLVAQLQHEINNVGYYWHSGTQELTTQNGVFRINCMDCLDRTNVVQSAFARFVLNEQLVRLGVHTAPEKGLAAYDGLEQMLNHLWANNGDYISRQYAGTSAMKGDFTRTGKRNIAGVVSDASYSIARLWISTFRDYFSQSVLDFTMGNHNAEAVYRTLVDLRSHEPDQAIQLTRARQAAIEASTAIVVNDGEVIHVACIVQSSLSLNTARTCEEADAVLILTDLAVYICRYHYQMEKVTEFLSIDLVRLRAIQHGAYITDTKTPQSLDPAYNHGIVFFFETAIARFNSGSEQNISSVGPPPPPASQLDDTRSSLTTTSGGMSTRVQSYISCKMVSKSQVIMQQLPEQPQEVLLTSMDEGSNVEEHNPVATVGSEKAKPTMPKSSLVCLDSFSKQDPEMLAEFICSAALSLKSIQEPAFEGKAFVVNSPIVSEADAKQNINIIEKVSSRIHKALWI